MNKYHSVIIGASTIFGCGIIAIAVGAVSDFGGEAQAVGFITCVISICVLAVAFIKA